MSGPTSQASDGGFAMIEALAAVAISAIAGATLLAALSAASSRSNESHLRELALRQAQALIAEAEGATNTFGLTGGGDLMAGALTWRRQISPIDMAGLSQIDVEVDWQVQHKKGATHLAAYRFGS